MRRHRTLRELEIAFAELVERVVETVADDRRMDVAGGMDGEVRHMLLRQVEELCVAWCRRMGDQALLEGGERSRQSFDVEADLEETLDQIDAAGSATLH